MNNLIEGYEIPRIEEDRITEAMLENLSNNKGEDEDE